MNEGLHLAAVQAGRVALMEPLDLDPCVLDGLRKHRTSREELLRSFSSEQRRQFALAELVIARHTELQALIDGAHA